MLPHWLTLLTAVKYQRPPTLPRFFDLLPSAPRSLSWWRRPHVVSLGSWRPPLDSSSETACSHSIRISWYLFFFFWSFLNVFICSFIQTCLVSSLLFTCFVESKFMDRMLSLWKMEFFSFFFVRSCRRVVGPCYMASDPCSNEKCRSFVV